KHSWGRPSPTVWHNRRNRSYQPRRRRTGRTGYGSFHHYRRPRRCRCGITWWQCYRSRPKPRHIIGKAFDNVDDLAASLLPVEEGTSVPLSDVADIEQTQAEAESVSRTNGKDSITLLVLPSNDANYIDLSERVLDQLDKAA